ncbi:hypothetical protein [Pectobacterium versatile]|uniref:hypothetical protein n=1 Tax=Pectobacterium versatile TaxID=2488639 RepID=UPI001CCE67E0|nr:hypothetical protein [Pectobacterium versatile]
MDEIRGLGLFGEYFKDYQDQYVLIGGVASWITLDEVGEPFRSTKDLDIVLIIETLTPEFLNKFWEFIKAGGYEHRQSGGEKSIFYRFKNPEDSTYPVQIEIFSRSPEGITPPKDASIIPIPTGEDISSLSAILLDDNYYAFLKNGLQQTEHLSYIGADRLIPFKMHAWLDLSNRKKAGETIDTKTINKHRNDVIRLSGQLTENTIEIPDDIRIHMEIFLAALPNENVNLRNLGISGSISDVIYRIKIGFGLV